MTFSMGLRLWNMLSCARRLVAKLLRFMVVMSNTTLLIFTSASRLVDLLGGTLVRRRTSASRL